MRIFKNIRFTRFARREAISDRALCEAIGRAERGLIDADLGGNVIKQRIPRPNQGRSGGFRSIILFRTAEPKTEPLTATGAERAVFVYGFAKNDQDNISEDNLKAFKLLASTVLSLDDKGIQTLLDKGDLTEVNCESGEL